MATIFALFEDQAALEQARTRLESRRSEVIPGMALPRESGDMTNDFGGRAPTGETKYVEGYTLEDELEGKGLPKSETRFFADALRTGASVLVVYDGSEETSEALRELGAAQISSN